MFSLSSSQHLRGLLAIVLALTVGVAAQGFEPPTAAATVMSVVSLAELSQEASAVVVARVERVDTRFVVSAEQPAPYTFTTLRVSEWVKGEGESTIVLREFGGVVGDFGTAIAGTPQYTVGEEVVVFVAPHPEDTDSLRTLGMVQGCFRILRGVPGVETVARRDLTDIGLYRGGEEVEEGSVEVSLPLSDLLARIRNATTGTVPVVDPDPTTGGHGTVR